MAREGKLLPLGKGVPGLPLEDKIPSERTGAGTEAPARGTNTLFARKDILLHLAYFLLN